MSDDEKKVYKDGAKDESESGSMSGSRKFFNSQSSVIEKKNQTKLAEKSYIEKRMNSFHQKLSVELGK